MTNHQMNMILHAIRELAEKTNQQYSELKADIDGIKVDVEGLKADVKELKGNVSELFSSYHKLSLGQDKIIERLDKNDEFVRHKLIEHEEDIFTLKKKVL